MSSRLLVGAARRDISPKAGDSLSGFVARLYAASGVSEPLCVRAVVVRHGESAVAIVAADLLGLAAWHVTEVREFAAERLNIPPQNVLLSATHTHSGPGVVHVRGCLMAPYDYHRSVVAAIEAAMEEASERCAPASLYTAAVPFEMGLNRRQETPLGVVLGVARDKPHPTSLSVAAFSGDRLGVVLFSHACHPYVLGGENLLASGDFPSFACHELEADGDTVAVFLNGCAGNIASIAAFQGLEAARREGLRMAEAVRGAVEALEPQEEGGVSGFHRTIQLPYAPLPSVEEIEQLAAREERVVRPEEKDQREIQKRLAGALYEWSALMRGIVRLKQPLSPVHCEIQALRIGSLVLLGIAGEPFFEIGEQIRAAGAGANVWALGYTSAYCGYLPTTQELRGGGYEVEDSWKYVGVWQLDDSCEDRVVSTGRTVLDRLP
jgi:neutral ceramidase